MKRIKKASIGQLLDVPVYTFASARSGNNGTLFRPAVVTDVYTNSNGEPCVKVEYPSEKYRHNKKITHCAYKVAAVYEYGALKCHQALVNEAPREKFFDGTYGDEIEFLIDKSFINDNVERDG